ncbi:MAG: DUF362 domain-containing protein [Firmicutes bacterium]|nr:DUF362 domain-containing protein [Bacillota bacterium]
MSENIRSKVALVKCDSYEQDKVDAAVRKAVEILGGLEEIDITKESRLVLKPNLLAKNPPEKACTTHPAVFAAVGKLLQDEGYTNLKYGDSPGNPVIKPEKIADECGLKTVADELGIPFGSFEEGVEIEFPEGRVADKFVICKEVVEADGIINVCKMKTHQLERITGAVKNTFGCVFGINKASSHARFSTAETFAKMIGDLNNLVRPKLHVMDGIVAMEGNGPQNGTPKQMGVILVSTDPVAIDGLFCHLVDLKPELVPTNVAAMEQGVGTYKDIIVITEDGEITPQEAAEKYGDKDFNVQRGKEYKGQLQAVRFLVPFLQKKPVVKESKCIGCGICVDSCPVEGKAIHVDGTAHYDYDKCIKCYCCQEMCPEDAITVKKSLLARIADRKWRV